MEIFKNAASVRFFFDDTVQAILTSADIGNPIATQFLDGHAPTVYLSACPSHAVLYQNGAS